MRLEQEQQIRHSDAFGVAWPSPGLFRKFISLFSLATILYHLLYLGDVLVRFNIVISRPAHWGIHFSLFFFLLFLLVPARRAKPRQWHDIALAFLSLLPGLYYGLFYTTRIQSAIGYVNNLHVIFGWLAALLALEATRRVLGLVFPIILGAFILYAMFSNYFPGPFQARGYPVERFGAFLYEAGEGVFGTVLGICATIIIVYIAFSQALSTTGAARIFQDTALALVGRFRGGPAKAAVIASCGFGTISGSAVANVLSTGVFTIPLMKKMGYKAHFAGAVESVSSLGGTFMPPVMAGTAFILAEFVGLPYYQVAIAAFVPAFLYYLAIFVMVHLEAVKLNLRGLSREEIPSWRLAVKESGWALVPLAALVYFLLGPQYSPEKAGIYSLMVLFLAGAFFKSSRLNWNRTLEIATGTVRAMLLTVSVCAAAGIIVGSFSITGLGVNLSYIVVDLARGNLPLLLLLTAGICYLMGLADSATSIYIFVAMLAAPALILVGVPKLAAHLFVYYYALITLITPPVAAAAYAAASLAQDSPIKIGFQAMRLAAAAYIVPFSFVFGSGILLIGSPLIIVRDIVTAVIGIIALACALQGYIFRKLNLVQRLLFFASGIALVFPGYLTDFGGIILGGLTFLWHIVSIRVKYKPAV